MTDHEVMMKMLADAGMRYNVVVHSNGSEITVRGPRSVNPMLSKSATFTFNKDGKLEDVEGA